MWPWPGGPGADLVGDGTFPRRSDCPCDEPSVRGRRLLRPWCGAMTDVIQFTIDGRDVAVPRGTTIFDAARLNGIPIPTLCHQQHQTPVGVCRVCVVDVGARVYTASCIRECEPGMTVKTDAPGVQQARSTLVEMLMSDHPAPCVRQQHTGDCELEMMAAHM